MTGSHSVQPPQEWHIRHVTTTGSTNADLVAAAAQGAPDRTTLLADRQESGRGRLGRTWQAPGGTSLLLSVLLRPSTVPLAKRGWAGALFGVAAATAIGEMTGLDCGLKWPNDVLIGESKVGGILAESAGDAVIVGVGINITTARADLPRADATSLVLAGATDCDRDRLAIALLAHLHPLLDRWYVSRGDVDDGAGDGLRGDYLARCHTIGQTVTVHLPDGTAVTGRAVDVRADGALVIDTAGSRRAFLAGDVQHLRPAPR